MQEKKLTKAVSFYMNIDEYNALYNYFKDDGRKIRPFLRDTIRQELNSGEIDINQIWRLGQSIKCEKKFTFLMTNNEIDALKNYVNNTKLTVSIFCRYVMKRELIRIETYNKEKSQTWDLD